MTTIEHLLQVEKKFGTILLDPPWSYNNQATRNNTDKHYPTMSLEEIEHLPIQKLSADKSHLHLWTTNAFLEPSLAMIRNWGFEFKGCFVWVKPQMGMGNYWRSSKELLLLGVKGGQTFLAHDEKDWGCFPRTKHSAKPPQVRDIIEKCSPAPRIELFARELAPGWASWGNEIPEEDFYTSLEAPDSARIISTQNKVFV